jgi:hypothetical protein
VDQLEAQGSLGTTQTITGILGARHTQDPSVKRAQTGTGKPAENAYVQVVPRDAVDRPIHQSPADSTCPSRCSDVDRPDRCLRAAASIQPHERSIGHVGVGLGASQSRGHQSSKWA